MSGSVNVASNKSALCKASAKYTNFSAGDTSVFDTNYDRLLVGYNSGSIPSGMKNKRITGVRLYLYGSHVVAGDCYLIADDWTENAVTYATMAIDSHTANKTQLNLSNAGAWGAIVIDPYYIRAILQKGAAFSATYGSEICNSRHATSSPYLVIDYGDDSPASSISSASPASGYIPKNTAKKFRWAIKQDGYCVNDVTVTNSKFRWKPSGGTATTVDCGTDCFYTLAGSSITADSIQWQCEVTDSLGNTVTSAWYTLTTVDSLSSAVVRSPMDTMVDGSADNVFRWEHVISTGTAPTASELQASSDGSTWTALASVSGSDLFTTIPAGTLTSGSLLWRVRTYNTDNAAGSWSDAASILVIAAPDAPAVSVEQTPRPLISWQSSGQQGYQIRIPGVWESGSVYGVDSSRKCPAILPDGEYTVEVRVVNEYGMWSEWGSAPLTVSNTPGAAITLTASASFEIMLNWSTAGSYTRYLVERDGEPVAVTAETAWTDVRAAGEHTYRVYGLTAGSDDYGVSGAVSVTLTVETNSITDLLTGQRLDLPYSTTQIQEEQITISRELELTHFAGAAYPSAELSESRDRALSFEAAFRDLGEGRRLEALVGRLVCIKAKNDESVTGVLAQLRKTSSAFWVDYEGEISQVDDREEVEL